jgi:hypothetical protein
LRAAVLERAVDFAADAGAVLLDVDLTDVALAEEALTAVALLATARVEPERESDAAAWAAASFFSSFIVFISPRNMRIDCPRLRASPGSLGAPKSKTMMTMMMTGVQPSNNPRNTVNPLH